MRRLIAVACKGAARKVAGSWDYSGNQFQIKLNNAAIQGKDMETVMSALRDLSLAAVRTHQGWIYTGCVLRF